MGIFCYFCNMTDVREEIVVADSLRDASEMQVQGEVPCQWHGMTAPEGREGRIIRAATDFQRLDATESSMQKYLTFAW